jgi:hypothetical protein
MTARRTALAACRSVSVVYGGDGAVRVEALLDADLEVVVGEHITLFGR